VLFRAAADLAFSSMQTLLGCEGDSLFICCFCSTTIVPQATFQSCCLNLVVFLAEEKMNGSLSALLFLAEHCKSEQMSG